MGDLSVQPKRGIQPALGDFSAVSVQLAAKDNKSSIDQKSEGCLSALWNSFLSVLSSIWNFFTGCCTYREKITEFPAYEKTTKEIDSSTSNIKMDKNLKCTHLYLNFKTAICKDFVDELKGKENKLDTVKEVWWAEINGKKILITKDIVFADNEDRTRTFEYDKNYEKEFDEECKNLLNSFSLHSMQIKKLRDKKNFEFIHCSWVGEVEESETKKIAMPSIYSVEKSAHKLEAAKDYISALTTKEPSSLNFHLQILFVN